MTDAPSVWYLLGMAIGLAIPVAAVLAALWAIVNTRR